MMKLFCKVMYKIFFLAFFFNESSGICQEFFTFDASIEIWTEKKEFFTFEPIWVIYRVENRDEKGPCIEFLDLNHEFVVKDSKGHKFSQKFFLDKSESAPMKPGEVLEGHVDLIYIYGGLGDDFTYPDQYFPPEKYTVQAVWKEFRKCPLVSNILEITVSDPTGDELKALNLFKEAIHLDKSQKNDEADSTYNKLVEQYPKSVYAPKALDFIIGNNMYKKSPSNREKEMLAGKKLLEQYPDSQYKGVAFGMVRGYYRRNKDMEGAKKYMKKLLKESPSIEMKKSAERILKDIEKDEL